MAVNKLLVAFDESEGADRALAMAASLAAVNPEAHVDVVYAVSYTHLTLPPNREV